MGCIDYKEREIILFENGTLGYLESDEDSDLRGGSSYVSIVNELGDLRSSPNFSPSGLDWDSMKKKYYKAILAIYGLVLILLFVPSVLERGTWNIMISDWTGIDFSGPARFGLAFVASMLAFAPEAIVGGYFSKRENQSILSLNSEYANTEIIVTDAAISFETQTTWKRRIGPFPLACVVLTKVVFMILIFIDFFAAVTLTILTPLFIIGLLTLLSFRNRQPLSEDEIEIREVNLSEIYDYILNRWGSTQLDNIISGGEGMRKEFKSSLWYDYDKADPNNKFRYERDYDPSDKRTKNERAKSVIKAVAGFLNSDVPGRLLIGVDNDERILGLVNDFELLNVSPSDQRNQFEMQLDDLLRKHLESKTNLRGLWDFSWLEQEEEGKLVCMLTITNSPQAVYHKVDGKGIYYRRTPSKTEPVHSGIELEKELEKFPR